MIDWRPHFTGDLREVVDALGDGIVSMSAGANSCGKSASLDGRDATGRFQWSAWVRLNLGRNGHADTLDEAKACAIAAAREILTAALAALD